MKDFGFVMDLEAIKAISGKERRGTPSSHLSLSSYSSLVPPRKKDKHVFGFSIFTTVAQATPLDFLVKRPAEFIIVGICILQKLLPKDLVSIHPEIRN